ncbi:MAG: [LysW]-aminoadipate/[LysW]-glutamate kinase [Candidatus Caldarchaeum sp.]|nr:[LysW]-aminoadipate/[LysW]-glutamate kinase [Candidatus Caldarchaeum sp.]
MVKAGGRALTSNMNNILDSVASRAGEGVVFVHGGGDIVSEYEERLGIEPKIVTSPSGIRSRLTDERELEVYAMVMAGKLGKTMSAYLNGKGVRTLNLAGVDAGLLRAQRKKKIIIVDERGRKRVVDGGYTGTIHRVEVEALKAFIDMNYLVVLTPLALGDEGEMLNVDGDSAAAAVATALKADRLYLLTDVEGVILNGEVVPRLTAEEATAALEKIGPGMNRKVLMAANAVSAGVKTVHICSGLVKDPLAEADTGSGTVVYNSTNI